MGFEDFMRACSTASEEQIKDYAEKNKKNIKAIDKAIRKVKKERGKVL